MVKREKIRERFKCILNFFLSKKNLGRDIIVVVIAVGLVGLFFINNRYLFMEKKEPVDTNEAPLIVNEAEDPTIDTTSWKEYQTKWYGFEIKYPENWKKPTLKSAVAGSNWEYRYQFRKQEVEENNPYIGLDVVVYNVGKVKELSNTNEFPAVKNKELKEQGICEEIEGHLAENENYPAEQIYIPSDDNCYNPAYFYTLTRGNYIYNIVPIFFGKEEKSVQSEREIIQNFPEFISAASTFNLIDIARPKPKAIITDPKPVAYKVDNLGRMVCNKKNDKPSKSKKDKKKHLDMECCLDPDEYPNPWCYYDPVKYGKYLK